MLGFRILLLITSLSACVPAGATPNNGQLIERRPYAARPYDAVPELARLFPLAEYEQALSDTAFAFERCTYGSDGLPVVAYLYGPRRPGARLPVIVFNRGSYVRGDIGAELLPMFHRLAKAGFLVIAPLYRGSDGAPGHDEMGGADLHDLMNVIPLAASLADADTSRLYLYGESRGGVMVFEALREGFPARAAATFGAFTDFDSLIDADRARYDRIIPIVWPEFASQHRGIAESRSAIRWAERLRAPLLLMQGGADHTVDPSHSLRLAQRLQSLEREYELHIFARDGHSLNMNHLERDAAAVRWFRDHMTR